VGTRSGSMRDKGIILGNKFSPLDSLRENSSSDEEEVVDKQLQEVEKEVDRPLRDKEMAMSKWDFLQRMTAANHPLMRDPEQLELTYRYIDLANSMLRKSGKRT
jgi:hypothetical protein